MIIRGNSKKDHHKRKTQFLIAKEKHLTMNNFNQLNWIKSRTKIYFFFSFSYLVSNMYWWNDQYNISPLRERCLFILQIIGCIVLRSSRYIYNIWRNKGLPILKKSVFIIDVTVPWGWSSQRKILIIKKSRIHYYLRKKYFNGINN